MGYHSKAPVVTDAILTAITTKVNTANAADPDHEIGVYDGPYVTGDTRDAIHIGYDANPDSEGEAGTSQQAWAGLGAKARDEVLTVNGAIHLLRGDAEVKSARDRAYQLLALVEDAIHPFPSMGVSPPTWAGVTSHRLLYIPGEDVGLDVLLPFVITVNTRL